MALVLGVGVGTFVLAMMWSLAFLVCILVSRAQGGVAYAGIGLFFLAGFVTLILLVLPREPKVPTAEQEVIIYDYSIIYRSLLIAGCGLFLIVGLVAYLILSVMEPIYAKRIRQIRS